MIIRRLAPLALSLLVLVVGATYLALSGLGPDRSWSTEEAAAAPVTAGTDLTAARMAASNAALQAGFLVTGTGQLADGTGQLADGAGELVDGISKAREGSQQLSDGMVQLQSAVGQLGDGATKIADGVDGAVESIVLLGAVRGQLLEAMADIDEELDNSLDPRASEMREQLQDFREQVEAVDVEEDLMPQLTELQTGSRELANQLATSGYAFHDGMYSATQGAKDLSSGLQELEDRSGEAIDGIDQLNDGAKRVDTMATDTQTQVNAVQRAIPAATAAASTTQEEQPVRVLSPLHALLVGALAALGGAVLGVVGMVAGRRRLVELAVAAVTVVAGASVLAVLLSSGLGVAAGALLVLGLALLTAASAGLAAAAVRLCGVCWGSIALAVASLAQIGLVGWVWKEAVSHDVPALARVVAGLMPLHYSTGILSGVVNQGSTALVAVGFVVLAVVAVAAFAALALVGVPAGRTGSPATAPEPYLPAPEHQWDDHEGGATEWMDERATDGTTEYQGVPGEAASDAPTEEQPAVDAGDWWDEAMGAEPEDAEPEETRKPPRKRHWR